MSGVSVLTPMSPPKAKHELVGVWKFDKLQCNKRPQFHLRQPTKPAVISVRLSLQNDLPLFKD